MEKKEKSGNKPTYDELFKLANEKAEIINRLTKDVERYKESGEQMGGEILLLKRSISSYKASNTKMRKRIEQLKTYGKEADELNEKRIAEIDDLKTTLRGKDSLINGLESQVKSRNDRIRELLADLATVKTNYEYYTALPWYKRIFFKRLSNRK